MPDLDSPPQENYSSNPSNQIANQTDTMWTKIKRDVSKLEESLEKSYKKMFSSAQMGGCTSSTMEQPRRVRFNPNALSPFEENLDVIMEPLSPHHLELYPPQDDGADELHDGVFSFDEGTEGNNSEEDSEENEYVGGGIPHDPLTPKSNRIKLNKELHDVQTHLLQTPR